MTSTPTPQAAAPPNRRRALLVLAIVAVVAIAVIVAVTLSGSPSKNSGSGSGSGGTSTDSRLLTANNTILGQLNHFAATLGDCKSNSQPITCTESAERTFSNQVHDYANELATTKESGLPGTDLSNALNAAQANGNLFEILGDAGPTAQNYNQVLNHVSISSNIDKLETALDKLSADLHNLS